jgi:hypothetical protein
MKREAIKEAQGKQLMAMAAERGKLELKRGLILYSAAGLAEYLKDATGNNIEFTAGSFYLALPHVAYKCELLTVIKASKAKNVHELHEAIMSKESVLLPWKNHPQFKNDRIELPIRMGKRKVYL